MKKKRIIAIISIIVVLSLMLTGCQSWFSGINDLKGDLVGNSYTIDTFDNFGNLTMKTHGDKINIEPNIVNEYSYGGSGWTTTETLSSVITINIDGEQLLSCGDTCIFYDDGLKPDYTFSVSEINSTADGVMDNTAVAGMVNSIKNRIGKSMVCVIKSQTGYPIYVFSGESVYWEVPEDLPKFTKLSIDSKPLYIHRANFQIIDKSLL